MKMLSKQQVNEVIDEYRKKSEEILNAKKIKRKSIKYLFADLYNLHIFTLDKLVELGCFDEPEEEDTDLYI